MSTGASAANLLLWLSWLHGGECFGLKWGNVGIIWLHEGPARDLPLGVGVMLLSLKPETKSNQMS